MTMTRKSFSKAWSNVLNLLIDLALIAMGAILYYHFEIRMLAPIDLHPFVVDLIGSKHTAVLLVAGAPFVVGVLDLIRTLFRMLRPRKPATPQASQTPAKGK